MRPNRILSLVGLAAKEGRIRSGEFYTEKAVKAGTAHLVLISGDASENTRKKFQNMCTFYEVPFYLYGTKQELGTAIGKEMRSSLAVTDAGLSDAIMKELANRDERR